jgi:hypothetical protein
MESGGIAGGWLSGRAGGISLTLSQIGMCLQAPSPLHSQSQVQLASAGVEVAPASASSAGPGIESSLLSLLAS